MSQERENSRQTDRADRWETDVPVRLNKFLAQAGLCSRREADRLIAEGKVLVDGRTAQVGQKVFPVQDVRLEGQRAEPEREQILLAFHKPRGVVCTTDKTWGDLTAEEVIAYPKRVFCVGRLDKESEGLLLMTNDGNLQHQITRAANYHEKEYVVRVDREVTPAFLDRMAHGVYLPELGVTTRPCKVQKTGKKTFRMILTQGLNRQIRRMCAQLGYRVERLQRVRVMNILLNDLPPGAYREISGEEEKTLRALAAQKGDR